jgi:hypothetical protein
MLALIFIDSRTLLGIDIWIKPMKFAISIAIYSLTLAVIMKYVRRRGIQKLVSYMTSIGLFLELIIIIFQAAQGKKSHFNSDTTLDIVIYGLMGLIIAMVTVALIILFVHIVRNKLDLPAQSKHTVNGDDGGAGIFILNWSTLVGDWRVVHFFGLHALQAIPLLTLILTHHLHSPKAKTSVTWVISILYLSFVIFTFIEASYGNPLIKL